MKRNIYNINGGTLEIFGFEPKPYAMDLLRIEELKKVPENEQILKKEDTRGWFTPKKGVLYECESYILRPYPRKKITDYSDLSRIRHSYVHGFYRHDPVKQHGDLITLHPRNGTSNNLINLTEDSYAAYLLDNEMFTSSFLEGRDLSSLKSIFEVSENPYITIDIDEFEKLCSGKVVKESFKDKMSDIEKESKVFQKIKRN